MKGKLMLGVAGAALMLLAVASPGIAGSGPRLAGAFKVDATIRANDFGVAPGTVSKDVYKFTSICKSGGCARVKLDRDGGNHAHYKSTLRRIAPGVYKGTEGPEAYNCPNNNAGSFTAVHTIRVTKTKNGRAAKIGGSTKITFKGCPENFINYTLKGTR